MLDLSAGGGHSSFFCPYLIDLPDGATVGPGAYIVGTWSGLPIAPDAKGKKCAVMNDCLNCGRQHWQEECPHQCRLLKLIEARKNALTERRGKKIMNFLESGRTKEDVLRDLGGLRCRKRREAARSSWWTKMIICRRILICSSMMRTWAQRKKSTCAVFSRLSLTRV